ncbi:MAG: hypothetical protein OSB09_07510 [Planctomycetota bacterium]|nr:hypothetical protein [Planctomycetota bacterium]
MALLWIRASRFLRIGLLIGLLIPWLLLSTILFRSQLTLTTGLLLVLLT